LYTKILNLGVIFGLAEIVCICPPTPPSQHSYFFNIKICGISSISLEKENIVILVLSFNYVLNWQLVRLERKKSLIQTIIWPWPKHWNMNHSYTKVWLCFIQVLCDLTTWTRFFLLQPKLTLFPLLHLALHK
jgi:hypothetical protein